MVEGRKQVSVFWCRSATGKENQGYNITSVGFWLKTHYLNLIIKRQQTISEERHSRKYLVSQFSLKGGKALKG